MWKVIVGAILSMAGTAMGLEFSQAQFEGQMVYNIASTMQSECLRHAEFVFARTLEGWTPDQIDNVASSFTRRFVTLRASETPAEVEQDNLDDIGESTVRLFNPVLICGRASEILAGRDQPPPAGSGAEDGPEGARRGSGQADRPEG